LADEDVEIPDATAMLKGTGNSDALLRGGRVFVAWTVFQRRVRSIATELNMAVLWLPVSRKGPLLKLGSYLVCMGREFMALRRAAPAEIWVQVPQVPALYPALLLRSLLPSRPLVVADCHNAMFRRPWSKWPLAFVVLNRCDAVLAHNAAVGRTAIALGVKPEKLWIVEDPPARFDEVTADAPSRPTGPTLLFPASYSKDEPIEDLIELARVTPEVTYMLSGNRAKFEARAVGHDVPRNIVPTGYLSLGEFEALLRSVDGVLALTTLEDCQLSACGEALGAGKPMMLSDTPVLREQFPSGAVHIRVSDVAGAAKQVRAFFGQLDILTKQASTLCDATRRDWHVLRIRPFRAKLARHGASTTPEEGDG
jgi:hypothetical protein